MFSLGKEARRHRRVRYRRAPPSRRPCPPTPAAACALSSERLPDRHHEQAAAALLLDLAVGVGLMGIVGILDLLRIEKIGAGDAQHGALGEARLPEGLQIALVAQAR